MSRIPVSIAFWLLTRAGWSPPAAIELLNDEIERERGALHLWRDGVRVTASHFRRHMSIGRSPYPPHSVAMVVPKVAWRTKPVFELDTDQIEAVIAEPKPKRPGRPRKEVDAAAIAAEKERRRAAKQPLTQEKIAKALGISKSTIRRRDPPKK